MNSTQIQALAVNDEVGVAYMGYRDTGPKRMRIGKISKINGHGHITVKFEVGGDLTFTKTGWEKGANHGGHYLVEGDRARENNMRRDQQEKVNLQMRQIVALIEGQKNGYGDYRMTPEVNESLANLVRYLPVAP